MKPTNKDRLTNSIMAGATIVTFIVCLIVSKDYFSQSFFENLLMVVIYLIASFFIGNIVIGIPIAVFHYITNYTFEDFYELTPKKRSLIIALLSAASCIIIAIIIT